VSYRTSKAAVNMVARCLAAEHGPATADGLRLTVVHPGWVDTDMVRDGLRDERQRRRSPGQRVMIPDRP
jgi:NAD(P)-dependent dehydrogenase (short-subunit alcohol dehydrogenase family)